MAVLAKIHFGVPVHTLVWTKFLMSLVYVLLVWPSAFSATELNWFKSSIKITRS